jgi:hypothetical protein
MLHSPAALGIGTHFPIFYLLTNVSLHCFICRCQAIEMDCENGLECRLLNKKIEHKLHYRERRYEFMNTGIQKDTSTFRDITALKVLINEKRGGLKVVAFNRSPFKLFTLRFSNKSVQNPSCERRRTSQRSLFLSFEINNCFQILA